MKHEESSVESLRFGQRRTILLFYRDEERIHVDVKSNSIVHGQLNCLSEIKWLYKERSNLEWSVTRLGTACQEGDLEPGCFNFLKELCSYVK
jgi:hypothetical protein